MKRRAETTIVFLTRSGDFIKFLVLDSFAKDGKVPAAIGFAAFYIRDVWYSHDTLAVTETHKDKLGPVDLALVLDLPVTSVFFEWRGLANALMFDARINPTLRSSLHRRHMMLISQFRQATVTRIEVIERDHRAGRSDAGLFEEQEKLAKYDAYIEALHYGDMRELPELPLLAHDLKL